MNRFELSKTITAEDYLKALKSTHGTFSPLDVRSEGEFDKGHLPGTINVPILENAHRREVGISYKHQGQEAAIHLGHELVDPQKNELVNRWKAHLSSQSLPVLFCWRGGMRSQIAQRWLAESGLPASKVEGGYKAIRKRLLQELESLPQILLLSGKTGSRKTELLSRLESPQVIDLERLANHRGSAFGLKLGEEQPRQASFENQLLFGLYSSTGEVLLEDESYLIGKRSLPIKLFKKMSTAPAVVIKVERDVRSGNIVESYISRPLSEDPESKYELYTSFQNAVERIGDRLGGALKKQVLAELTCAFSQSDFCHEAHQKWVTTLLEKYYDKAYSYSFARNPREILFTGDSDECEAWLRSRLMEDRQ